MSSSAQFSFDSLVVNDGAKNKDENSLAATYMMFQ
jgi:hypothetical protein